MKGNHSASSASGFSCQCLCAFVQQQGLDCGTVQSICLMKGLSVHMYTFFFPPVSVYTPPVKDNAVQNPKLNMI